MSVPPDLVDALAAKVKALSPPDRLRLAAGLLEERAARTALVIVRMVANELEMALILAERPRPKR